MAISFRSWDTCRYQWTWDSSLVLSRRRSPPARLKAKTVVKIKATGASNQGDWLKTRSEAGVLEQTAPAGRGFLHSNSQKGERDLAHDEGGNQDGTLDQQVVRGKGKDVSSQDTPVRGT